MAQRGITKNSLTSDISAEHFAALFKSLYGKSGICDVFNGLVCTKVDNNTVRLASGIYSLSGYMVMVDEGTTEDLTIDSGTSGQNRHDLVVAEFVRNGGGVGVDTLHFTIIKGTQTAGTPEDPDLIQQDINGAGVTRQEPLYRVKIEGIDIVSIEPMADTITSIASHQAENASKHITESGSNDDGYYIKFDDGTMWCYNLITIPYSNANECFATWTFPQPFLEGSVISRHGTHNTESNVQRYQVTGVRVSGQTGQPHVGALVRALSYGGHFTSDSTVSINVFAIGRWK